MAGTLTTVRSDISIGNTSEPPCPDTLPRSSIYLEEMTTGGRIMIGLSGVLTLVILVLYVENGLYCLRNYSCKKTMKLSLWLTGLHPVFALTSLVAILIPRSTLINEFVASIYLSISLYLFLGLMIRYHGGEDNLILEMEYTEVPLRSPPVACCCFCCPNIKLTRQVLHRIEFCVMQIAFVHPTMIYISTVLWTDDQFVDGRMSLAHPNLYIATIRGSSTTLALYGLVLMYRVSSKHLKSLHILPKFIILKLVLVFSDLQLFVFGILNNFNIPSCKNNLSSSARGKIIYHMMLIIEMLFLMLIARHHYRKMENPMELLESTVSAPGFMTSSDEEIKTDIKEMNTIKRANYQSVISEKQSNI